MAEQDPRWRPDATDELAALMRERIVILDGAMGTAIQRDRPDEAGYRGERFASREEWPGDLQGNNDLLSITQPQIIAGIHREYLEAGADIVETNTFSSNAVSLADYGMEELAYELNFESARLAREVAEETNRLRRDLKSMLRMGTADDATWSPRVLSTTATALADNGIPELVEALDAHHAWILSRRT